MLVYQTVNLTFQKWSLPPGIISVMWMEVWQVLWFTSYLFQPDFFTATKQDVRSSNKNVYRKKEHLVNSPPSSPFRPFPSHISEIFINKPGETHRGITPTPKAPGTNAIPQTSNDVVDQQHHYEAHNHLNFHGCMAGSGGCNWKYGLKPYTFAKQGHELETQIRSSSRQEEKFRGLCIIQLWRKGERLLKGNASTKSTRSPRRRKPYLLWLHMIACRITLYVPSFSSGHTA